MGIRRPESHYIPRKGEGAPRITRQDLSLGGAIAEKWGKEENKLLAVFDILASGQQGLAGVATELARRETGHRSIPIMDAFKGGMARSASFSEVTGDPWSGLILDLGIDPINLAGTGFIPKGVKLVTKIPVLAKAGRTVYEVTEAAPHIRKAKEAFGTMFRSKHLLRKRNPKEVTEMLENYRGEINFHLHTAGKIVGKKIVEVVPDGQARRKIGILMDSEPVIKQEGSFEFERWRDAFQALTPDEKTAYLLERTHLDALEKLKIASGRLTEGRIAGFYEKFQRKYVPFRLATKDALISDIRSIKEGVAAGDESAIEILGRFDKGMDDLDTLLDAAERTDDMWLSFRERARKMYREGDMPSWAHRRKTTATLEQIAKETDGLIEADIAKLAHIEAKEVATAFSSVEYAKQLVKWMRNNDLIFPTKMDGDEINTVLTAKRGAKEAANRLRDGFKPVPGIDVLKGYKVPNSIADEIASVVKRASDPTIGKRTLRFIQKAVQWDKAHRLMWFPEFHSRNYFSNKFNMMLGGFNPVTDIKHYYMAQRLLWKWSHGEGIYEAGKGAGRMFGLTEPELYKLALKHRVIGSGETAGELGMVFEQHATHSNIFMNFLDPRTNIATKIGFKVGRFIEDGDRLAFWFSKLAKGMDKAEAGRLTNKFMLDYRHGLSGFESEYFRNLALPFYAWFKMNMLLQLEMLALQPHKYVPFVKGKRFLEDQFGGPEPKMIEEADWIRKNLSIRIGYDEKTGDYKYFIFNSWWPAADLDKLWGTKIAQEILNQINPWIKIHPELWFNFSLFQKRKIREYPGQKKKLLGVSLPAKVDHFLRIIRQINTTDRILKTMFPDEGATPGTIGWGFFQLMAGKIYPQDPEKQAKWWKYGIDRNIRYMKGKLKGAKKRGDTGEVRTLEREIKRLEDVKRKHLGIRG